MNISDELIQELTKDCKTQDDFNELFKWLKKRGLEAALAHSRAKERKSNTRNGYSKKTVRSSHGPIELDIPRDRQGDFEPQLISRYQTSFDAVDEKIIALYARGLSVRDIQKELSGL